jgi:hypothetical protein
MMPHWAASTLLATEKNFRRILGCERLRMLKACLDEEVENVQEARRGRKRVVRRKKAG